MTIPEKIYGIIGHPLGHTLSPVVHNWGFAQRGLAACYAPFPTPPERLAEVIRAVRALPVWGLSVTIPHKEAVMPLVDGVSEAAARIGAVNTLVWQDGGLIGHNTDVTGFLEPLRPLPAPKRAVLLGAGGAAKAVLAGLSSLGVADIAVTNRDPGRALALAQAFNARAVPWEERLGLDADIFVNATPLGMSGPGQNLSPLEGYPWRAGQIAYDLVYNPRRTRFLAQAQAGGAAAIDGLNMFVGQAAEQFRLWTGLELPRAGAARLVEEALGLG